MFYGQAIRFIVAIAAYFVIFKVTYTLTGEEVNLQFMLVFISVVAIDMVSRAAGAFDAKLEMRDKLKRFTNR